MGDIRKHRGIQPHPSIQVLENDPHGKSRLGEVEPFLGMDKTTFTSFVKAGKAPQPIRLSTRMIFYRNHEILDFIRHPEKWVLGMDENGNAMTQKD